MISSEVCLLITKYSKLQTKRFQLRTVLVYWRKSYFHKNFNETCEILTEHQFLIVQQKLKYKYVDVLFDTES